MNTHTQTFEHTNVIRIDWIKLLAVCVRVCIGCVCLCVCICATATETELDIPLECVCVCVTACELSPTVNCARTSDIDTQQHRHRCRLDCQSNHPTTHTKKPNSNMKCSKDLRPVRTGVLIVASIAAALLCTALSSASPAAEHRPIRPRFDLWPGQLSSDATLSNDVGSEDSETMTTTTTITEPPTTATNPQTDSANVPVARTTVVEMTRCEMRCIETVSYTSIRNTHCQASRMAPINATNTTTTKTQTQSDHEIASTTNDLMALACECECERNICSNIGYSTATKRM